MLMSPPVSQRSPVRLVRVKRLLVWCHRWIALTLGLLLVVFYASELLRASNAELFHSTQAEQPIGFAAAIDAVKKQDPEFEPAEIALKDGIFMLADAESEMTYFVDAGTGTLNGRNNLYGGVVGFLENLHDGALTCEGFAGYTPWLSSPAPVASLSPFEEMTWGAVLLAIAGAALVFLAATAPFIWWPGLRRWRNAFRPRWRSGRYARDFDLHNVIGIVALVPLLVWG